MNDKFTAPRFSFKELLFQVVLHVVVFVFYSFDRNDPQIKPYQVAFFLNYTVAAFIINYFLLPRFLYKKLYIRFVIYFTLIIAIVIFLEEAVIEQIYFPDTRGRRFVGVFFSLWGVLPVITVLCGFKFAWDALGIQKEVEDLKNTLKESELQFLKSQINPHFLFNNLNNLYAYAIENSPKTLEIILNLSAVLRYMLYDCKARYVPLSKEIEQLENFIDLSKLQLEERGEVQFTTQNIRPGYQIAPLILMVFVENAFKHSASSQTDEILIEIDLQLTESGTLHFICKNTFLPQSNTASLSSGIGLENVKKRLQLLYPKAHELRITSGENQYEVDLFVDLNKTV